MKARLVNWVPLLVMILAGTPKRHTSSFKNLISDLAVTFLTAVTSSHFVNLSIVTNKNSKPPIAQGKGPRISSPQTENDHVKGLSEELGQADGCSSNGTGRLHIC